MMRVQDYSLCGGYADRIGVYAASVAEIRLSTKAGRRFRVPDVRYGGVSGASASPRTSTPQST